jgi:ABC-type uncharacterized transport system substrate-binding protein
MRNILAFLIVLLFSTQAHAHPHQWLDYKIKLIFNQDKSLKSIHQAWVFDSFYAALLMPEYDTNKNNTFDAPELMELAHENINNLKEYDYFTTIESNGKKQVFEGVRHVRSYLQNNLIVMEFTVDLQNPVKTPFIYSVYDPSYYIEMKHMKTDPVSFEGAACKADISKPNPDSVYIKLAQSLDKNAIAPDNLGLNFAEKASVTCP